MKKTPTLRIGASSFTAPGWKGSFYPEELPQSQYLTYYAEQFDTVEIDSTFYAVPRHTTVQGWYEKTPKDFVFSAKVPQTITHEKVLEVCGDDLRFFLSAMEPLKEKLGALLFQFPYFNKKAFATPQDFFARVRAFLKTLPKDSGFHFALEVRNKNYLLPELFAMLQEHDIALTLLDHPYMPRPALWFAAGKPDPLTAEFTYIRLIGDRYGLEEITKVFDKVVIDRARELEEWTGICTQVRRRGVDMLVYINNHFAGHAPTTIRQLHALWEKALKEAGEKVPERKVEPVSVPKKTRKAAPKKDASSTGSLFPEE